MSLRVDVTVVELLKVVLPSSDASVLFVLVRWPVASVWAVDLELLLYVASVESLDVLLWVEVRVTLATLLSVTVPFCVSLFCSVNFPSSALAELLVDV